MEFQQQKIIALQRLTQRGTAIATASPLARHHMLPKKDPNSIAKTPGIDGTQFRINIKNNNDRHATL